MPSFLREMTVRNVVLNEEAMQELNSVLQSRIDAHNTSAQDSNHRLAPVYVVRFDSRSYRTFSAEEAWGFYKGANSVERVYIGALSQTYRQTSGHSGSSIQIMLDTYGNSNIGVEGESKDWVEATLQAFDVVLRRRRDLATALIRTSWTSLVLQVIGLCIGVLLALWLATLSAPFLKGVDYPRAVSFVFWFLVYSNLWGYLQQQALKYIGVLFPNVRFSRGGEHWTQRLLREGVKTIAIALLLWVFGWLTRWAAAVIAPILTQ